MKWVYQALILTLLSVQSFADGNLRWEIRQHDLLTNQARGYVGDIPDSKHETVVRLLDRRNISISDSKVVEKVDRIYFYPNNTSVQNDGMDRVDWNTSGEDLRILESAVVTPDGAVHHFDPDTAEINDTDSYDLFTDTVELIIQLPRLSAGSLSVLSYERELVDPSNYHFNILVKDGAKSLEKEIKVEWSGQAPAWHQSGTDMSCETTSTTLTCRAQNLPPADPDVDVLYADVLPQLIISTSNTWEDVISDMWALTEPAMQAGPLLEQAIKTTSSEDQPLYAAHDLATRSIRYVSYSKGKHARRPHLAEQTLDNRYGDCKDKSVLLLALLRAAGISAYPVLVATDRRDASALVVPSWGYFDHMVVCAVVNGVEQCLDPTDVNTPASTTSHGIQGKVRLNILPGAVPTNIAAERYRWRIGVDTDFQFLPDGGQMEKSQRSLTGALASLYRQELGSLDNRKALEWLRDQYHEVVSTKAEPEFRIGQLEDTDSPLTLYSEAKYGPILDTEEALDYTDTTAWLRTLIAEQYIENKYYSIFFSGLHATATLRFDLNNLWRPKATGPEVSFSNEYGKYERTYKTEGDSIVVYTSIDMPARKVDVEDFERFNRFLELIHAETSVRFWGSLIN